MKQTRNGRSPKQIYPQKIEQNRKRELLSQSATTINDQLVSSNVRTSNFGLNDKKNDKPDGESDNTLSRSNVVHGGINRDLKKTSCTVCGINQTNALISPSPHTVHNFIYRGAAARSAARLRSVVVVLPCIHCFICVRRPCPQRSRELPSPLHRN